MALDHTHVEWKTAKEKTRLILSYSKSVSLGVFSFAELKLESTKRAFFYKGADIFNNCI